MTNHILPHQSNERQVKTLFALVVLTVGAVTIISFLISFRALSDIAAANGKNALESWLWPLTIDGAIAAFSLAGVLALSLGRSPTWPRLLVALASFGTIYFNFHHAPATTLGPIVSVTAPLMFLLSFECLLWLIRGMTERQTLVISVDELQARQVKLSAKVNQLTDQRDKLNEDVKQLRQVKRQLNGKSKPEGASTSEATVDRARAILRQRVGENEPLPTGAELGRLLNVSRQTGANVKKMLLPEFTNGKAADR